MVTLGEAAGENLHFTANAIVVTAPITGFPAHFREVADRGYGTGVSDTQNVIKFPLNTRACRRSPCKRQGPRSLPRAVGVATL